MWGQGWECRVQCFPGSVGAAVSPGQSERPTVTGTLNFMPLSRQGSKRSPRPGAVEGVRDWLGLSLPVTLGWVRVCGPPSSPRCAQAQVWGLRQHGNDDQCQVCDRGAGACGSPTGLGGRASRDSRAATGSALAHRSRVGWLCRGRWWGTTPRQGNAEPWGAGQAVATRPGWWTGGETEPASAGRRGVGAARQGRGGSERLVGQMHRDLGDSRSGIRKPGRAGASLGTPRAKGQARLPAQRRVRERVRPELRGNGLGPAARAWGPGRRSQEGRRRGLSSDKTPRAPGTRAAGRKRVRSVSFLAAGTRPGCSGAAAAPPGGLAAVRGRRFAHGRRRMRCLGAPARRPRWVGSTRGWGMLAETAPARPLILSPPVSPGSELARPRRAMPAG